MRLAIEPLEPRLAPAVLLSGFTESLAANGLSNPTAMEFSPDGKLFVAEQAGTLEVWQGGARLQANFFRDTPLATDPTGERGLLGIAFDPNFAANRFVYAYYTTLSGDRHNRVSRFTANAAGDLALSQSETVLLELDPHTATNHNGGAIHFGPDGRLYIGVGDNANQDNPTGIHNSQRLTTLHGKMLRINPDGSIPADNPFVAQTTGKYQSIWATGLRNPYTFAFDSATGRMFINDVGQLTWEEINVGTAGANYGWPATEGSFNQGAFPNFTQPFFAYNHNAAVSVPSGIAVTGGTFYRPTVQQFGADYAGDYFFSDLGAGWIYRIDPTTRAISEFATGLNGPVDLEVDADGNLYCLEFSSGNVIRISRVLSNVADTVGVYVPNTATFYLRNSLSSGFADIGFNYGAPNWVPLAGDWNGDGVDSVGVYVPGTATFYLRNSLSTGIADIGFNYGAPNWIPLVGDWNGDGVDSIGVYVPGTATFYLRNSLSPGFGDIGFNYGEPNSTPLVGDWNGDGVDSIGVYVPGTATFHLRNSLSTGFADIGFNYGAPNWRPLAGDWNGTAAANLMTMVEAIPGKVAAMLTQAETEALVGAAAERLKGAAALVALDDVLAKARIVVTRLPNGMLGRAIGDTIYLDDDAAGHGWFIDQTPHLDEEFKPQGNTGALDAIDPRAVDRIDLLSVVEHELGHLAGLADLDDLDGVMGRLLMPGMRRTAVR